MKTPTLTADQQWSAASEGYDTWATYLDNLAAWHHETALHGADVMPPPKPVCPYPPSQASRCWTIGTIRAARGHPKPPRPTCNHTTTDYCPQCGANRLEQ